MSERDEVSYGFRRSDAGRLVLRTDLVERGLLDTLADQIMNIMAPTEQNLDLDPIARMVGIDPEVEAPTDEVVRRLLPDAYREDPESTADFRRFTDRELRTAKVAHAAVVRDCLARSGEKVTLSADEAQSWLAFLNDARLALGTRIGITEDNHEELSDLPEDDPRSGMYHVYDWLTFLQESLLQASFFQDS
jgi:hypothetical protein